MNHNKKDPRKSSFRSSIAMLGLILILLTVLSATIILARSGALEDFLLKTAFISDEIPKKISGFLSS